MTTYLRVASAVVSVLILTACAATTATVKPNASTPSLAQNLACLTQTGSRIATKSSDCSAFGRSYSSDDISHTGSPEAGEALRLLDPSITVHR
jgi:hypothetical protein